jgi:hypothetical protein
MDDKVRKLLIQIVLTLTVPLFSERNHLGSKDMTIQNTNKLKTSMKSKCCCSGDLMR